MVAYMEWWWQEIASLDTKLQNLVQGLCPDHGCRIVFSDHIECLRGHQVPLEFTKREKEALAIAEAYARTLDDYSATAKRITWRIKHNYQVIRQRLGGADDQGK